MTYNQKSNKKSTAAYFNKNQQLYYTGYQKSTHLVVTKFCLSLDARCF